MEYSSDHARYEGVIQIDRSGQGHRWETVDPADLRPDVLAALAETADSGEIEPGQEVTVGGVQYRAI